MKFSLVEKIQNDDGARSEEHTSELQSPCNLVCRLLLEKKKTPLTFQTIMKTMASSATTWHVLDAMRVPPMQVLLLRKQHSCPWSFRPQLSDTTSIQYPD